MELILIGINGLLLLALWRYILRKSILDAHRDALFDLRDSLRSRFLENGWSLDTPIYKRLRDLINSYLRFTERFSLMEFAYLESAVKKSDRLKIELSQNFIKEFTAPTREQQVFVREFRQNAVRVMMSYMILSSGPLVVCTILLLPVVGIYGLIEYICKGIARGSISLADKASALGQVFSALIRLTVGIVASKILFEEFVEEYSYRRC